MTKRKLTLILVLAAVLAAHNARADSFLVTLDTSPLSGTQILGFGLTNFDSASNAASLSAFNFDGGSAVVGSDDCTFGGTFSGLGCSGDLTSGIALQDIDPTGAFFTQQFNPGSSLSFLLTISNFFGGGVPDQFAMYLCDVTFNCYSDDATGAMLLLDLAGGTLSPSSFALFGAGDQNLDTPVVTAVPQVPEPATLLLLGSALTAIAARGRKRWGRN
jgi:hypothetical protein